MAELIGEHMIEVRVGSGQPPTMRIRPSEPLGPLSVGTEGAWRIIASGVARKHAEVYFDGKELFVRSVDPGVPALIDGNPIPYAWMTLQSQSMIMLGDARLWIDVASPSEDSVSSAEMLEDDDNVATSVAEPSQRPWGDINALVQQGIQMAQLRATGQNPIVGLGGPGVPPMPAPPKPLEPPKPSDPFWPAGQSAPPTKDDSGMTRIDPIDLAAQRKPPSIPSKPSAEKDARATLNIFEGYDSPGQAPAPPPSGSGAMSPAPSWGPQPPAYGGTMVLPDAPLPAPPLTTSSVALPLSQAPAYHQMGVPPPSGPMPSPSPGFRMDQPISIEGMVQAGPPAGKGGWRELSLPKKLLVILFVPFIASVVVIFMGEEFLPIQGKPKTSTSARPSAKPAATTAPMASTAVPSTPPTTEPIETAQATTSPSGTTSPTASASVAATSQPQRPPDSEKVAPGKLTLQRQAADAVAAGNFARAAELYRELAEKYPNKPAYAEAATVMSEKAAQRR